jgi:hypothetical protein
MLNKALAVGTDIGVLRNEEWLRLAVARFGCLLPLWNDAAMAHALVLLEADDCYQKDSSDLDTN